MPGRHGRKTYCRAFPPREQTPRVVDKLLKRIFGVPVPTFVPAGLDVAADDLFTTEILDMV